MATSNAANAGLTIAGTKIDNSDESFQTVEKYLTVPSERQQHPDFDSADKQRVAALENPIARQIVDAMKASDQGVKFADNSDIIDNIKLRLAAINAFANCNTGAYDMDYFDPATNLLPRIGTADASRLSEYWSFMHPAETWDAEFEQVDGTVASDAMAPIQGATFPFRGECAGAFQMAVYYGLLNGLGATRFDQMAASWGKMYIGPWSIGPKQTPNPATLFMQSAPLSGTHIPGDYMYFKNKDDYLHWAPDGFWTGLNAMYMGNDMLGTPHYSGMGASWLSETNLRAALVNAYYHDCYPHTIADPLTEVRFTIRNTLQIPVSLEQQMPESNPQKPANSTAPTAESLKSSGFNEVAEGQFGHAGTTVGALATALGFNPQDLRQVVSAGRDNPTHKVTLNGVSVIVHYNDANAPRHDPNSAVTAHVNLAAHTKAEE